MWYENLNVLSAIGVVLVLLVTSGVLLFKGKKEESKKIILSLVIEAEQKFGAGTGALKFAFVIGFVYPKLPKIVRLFITENALDSMIESALTLLKTELQPVPVTEVVVSKTILQEPIEAIEVKSI